jgi:hypothetical protein
MCGRTKDEASRFSSYLFFSLLSDFVCSWVQAISQAIEIPATEREKANEVEGEELNMSGGEWRI